MQLILVNGGKSSITVQHQPVKYFSLHAVPPTYFLSFRVLVHASNVSVQRGDGRNVVSVPLQKRLHIVGGDHAVSVVVGGLASWVPLMRCNTARLGSGCAALTP